MIYRMVDWLQALSNPNIAFPALGLGASLPIYRWVTSRLGYAGQLPAEEVDEILELEDSLLLDVRCPFTPLHLLSPSPASCQHFFKRC